MSLKIGILLGDDIGLEVVPECVKVMKAAAARERLAIEWQALPIGKQGHIEHGNTLPRITEEALRELDGWVMGPIGHAAYPRGDATWVMPPVRKKFELFAAVRPALSHTAALQVMLESSQGQFDPALLQVFQRCAPQFERIYREFPD